MDERGLSPTASTVRQMTNLLPNERVRSISTSPPTVGECWVRTFINRHDDLKSRYFRKYDHQRAECEYPEIIRG